MTNLNNALGEELRAQFDEICEKYEAIADEAIKVKMFGTAYPEAPPKKEPAPPECMLSNWIAHMQAYLAVHGDVPISRTVRDMGATWDEYASPHIREDGGVYKF